MSRHYAHTLSDGQSIRIRLKRSAKKNLILRPVSRDTVSINVPPFVSHRTLAQWLTDNEPLLRRTLAQAPTAAASADTLPEWIWYQGVQTTLSVHNGSHIQIRPSEILLPDKEPAAQLTHLRRFLHERAREYLLPRLEHHARATALIPAATALSNAKTFWGVCRHTTGIRLNWRLIGAPRLRRRLHLHPRTLPPAPPRPQSAVLGNRQPPHPAHPSRRNMAESPRPRIVCIRLKRAIRRYIKVV